MAEDKTDNTPANNTALSRRDFLRRASKEAAETGTKLAPLVPGAGVARAVLGIGEAPEKDTTESEDAPSVARMNAPRWLRRFVAWRAERNDDRSSEGKPTS